MKPQRFLPSLIVLAFLSPVVGAAEAPAKETVTDVITTLDHVPGEPAPTLRCSPLNHCLITFPADAVLGRVLIPDPYRWIVDPLTAGGHPILAITPRHCDVRSRVTIATDLHLFDFTLESVCRPGHQDVQPVGPATHLVIHRPPTIELPVPPPAVAAEPAPPPVPAIPTDRLVRAHVDAVRLDLAQPAIYEDEDGRTVVEFLDAPERVPVVGTMKTKRRLGFLRRVPVAFEPLPGATYDPLRHRLVIPRRLGEETWTVLLHEPAKRLRRTPRLEIRRPRR